jgi:REP element-mobilizing transposase RayT
MPTRLRVDLAGYHHIINRGVNRCDVFNCNDDKEMFLQIINKSATLHKIVLHDYCLMDNHYHLLIETKNTQRRRYLTCKARETIPRAFL